MRNGVVLLTILIFTSVNVSYAQELERDLGNSRQTVNMVYFSPDGKYLMAGGFMKIWDTESGTISYSSSEKGMEFAIDLILSASKSSDGRYIALVKTGRLQVIDLTSRTMCANIKGIKIAGTAFGPDNKTLAYVQSDGKIAFVNAANGTDLSERKLPNIKPLNIAWSPDGRFLALGGRDNSVALYDVEKKVVSASSAIGASWVSDLEFSPDSKYLAIALRNGIIRLVESDSGGEIAFWQGHQGNTSTICFHPSGKLLASGGADNFVRIWEIPSGNPLKAWEAHQKNVTALSFSPDGLRLATGSFNTPIGGSNDTKIWKMDNTALFSTAIAIKPDSEAASISEPYKQAVSPIEKELANNDTDQKRLALIIGNGIYHNGGILANPENDANDIGRNLKQLGFEVMLFNNLDQKGFRKAIDDFGVRLSGFDIGLFYYAGHGIQVKGNNYLIPVDANLKSENDVEYDCVNAGRLLAKMEDAGSKTNIIILDACRDNPFERSWRRSAQGQGLAFMTAPAGSLISYATSPGATASDGSGRNGLFTSALLSYINEPNLSILEMFQKVRTYVRENSNGEQVPWESTSLEGNFYFKR